MKQIKTVLTILTLTTFIVARRQNNLGQIPTRVKVTADSVIIATIGTNYFKATTFDCDKSLLHVTNPDHLILNGCRVIRGITKKVKTKKGKAKNLSFNFYVLRYCLTLKENATYGFEVRIDSNLKLKENVSLPDCINKNSCDIKVDSLTAIELATKYGLEKGLGIKSKLIYDTETQSFQWEIKNHLETKPNRGNIIYINPQTGERISSKDKQWIQTI